MLVPVGSKMIAGPSTVSPAAIRSRSTSGTSLQAPPEYIGATSSPALPPPESGIATSSPVAPIASDVSRSRISASVSGTKP